MNPAIQSQPFLVACLCAAWCRTCTDYRSTFETLRREFAAQAHFVWIDIEDDEELLGEVDVADFPTLLMARRTEAHDEIGFFGPVLPHLQTARQLIQHALGGDLRHTRDPAPLALAARLREIVQGPLSAQNASSPATAGDRETGNDPIAA